MSDLPRWQRPSAAVAAADVSVAGYPGIEDQQSYDDALLAFADTTVPKSGWPGGAVGMTTAGGLVVFNLAPTATGQVLTANMSLDPPFEWLP